MKLHYLSLWLRGHFFRSENAMTQRGQHPRNERERGCVKGRESGRERGDYFVIEILDIWLRFFGRIPLLHIFTALSISLSLSLPFFLSLFLCTFRSPPSFLQLTIPKIWRFFYLFSFPPPTELSYLHGVFAEIIPMRRHSCRKQKHRKYSFLLFPICPPLKVLCR